MFLEIIFLSYKQSIQRQKIIEKGKTAQNVKSGLFATIRKTNKPTFDTYLW